MTANVVAAARGFSFLSSRSNRGSSEREEEALTIDELTQITTELAEYDRVLANEFAALAKRANTDEAGRMAIDNALQHLAKETRSTPRPNSVLLGAFSSLSSRRMKPLSFSTETRYLRTKLPYRLRASRA